MSACMGGRGSACAHTEVDARSWACAGPWEGMHEAGREVSTCMSRHEVACARMCQSWGGLGDSWSRFRGPRSPPGPTPGVFGAHLGGNTHMEPPPRAGHRPSQDGAVTLPRPPQDGAVALSRRPQDGGRKWLRSASVKLPRSGSSFQDGGVRGILLAPGFESQVAGSRHRLPPLPQEGLASRRGWAAKSVTSSRTWCCSSGPQDEGGGTPGVVVGVVRSLGGGCWGKE